MIDKEKVIKGLNCCAEWMDNDGWEFCNKCPYHPDYSDFDHKCLYRLNNDAIVLLNEQEAVKPKKLMRSGIRIVRNARHWSIIRGIFARIVEKS